MTENRFIHPHRVSYSECTVGNHVYYSRYLDIFEEARGEFFRSLGLTLLQLQEQDTIFPVIEARVRYARPARYDDVLSVEVWPTLAEKVRLNFACRVLNSQGQVLVEMESCHVCTTMAEKPRRLPVEILEKLRPFLF